MRNRLINLLLLPAMAVTALSAQTSVNPLIHNGIVVALSDNVDNYIFANYLVLHPSPDSCVRYSFSSAPNNVVRNFQCNTIGTTPLSIWTFSTGALAPLETRTYAIIQDNLGVCPGSANGQLPIVCCRNGLAAALNGDAEVTVTPGMWDLSTAVCNNDPNITLSFSADPTDTTRVFGCFETGVNILQIWATSGSGHQNYAEVYCYVQDNTDNCGGSGDIHAPLPVASSGLSSTFSYSGTIVLRAEDVDAGSRPDSADCLPLRFSFSADTNDVTLTYTCSTLGTKQFNLWVTDACGHQNFVQTFLLVNNNGACSLQNAVPSNDNRADALELSSAGECARFWSNMNATTEIDEPQPATGSCSTPNTWCDPTGPEHTVWFSFEAPASGSAELLTAGMNTQMAVWELINGDLVLVAANDDLPGNPEGAAGLTLSCLESGKTYWVQIDGFNGATGQFSIQFSDPEIVCAVSGQNNLALACGEKSVSPVQSTGTGAWQFLLDGDQNPVLAINDMGNTLGAVQAEYMVNGDAVRTDAAGNPYLDRNWTITVENQPATPVYVKLLFRKSEWETLAGTAGAPGAPDQLVATKVSGATCGNYVEGGNLLPNLGSYAANAAGDLINTYEVEGFSAFYLHGGNALTATRAPQTLPLGIFPNPSRGTIRITGLPITAQGIDLTLSDLTGRVLLRKTLYGSEATLNLPNLLQGLYLLQGTDGRQSFAGKVAVD